MQYESQKEQQKETIEIHKLCHLKKKIQFDHSMTEGGAGKKFLKSNACHKINFKHFSEDVVKRNEIQI